MTHPQSAFRGKRTLKVRKLLPVDSSKHCFQSESSYSRRPQWTTIQMDKLHFRKGPFYVCLRVISFLLEFFSYQRNLDRKHKWILKIHLLTFFFITFSLNSLLKCDCEHWWAQAFQVMMKCCLFKFALISACFLFLCLLVCFATTFYFLVKPALSHGVAWALISLLSNLLGKEITEVCHQGSPKRWF